MPWLKRCLAFHVVSGWRPEFIKVKDRVTEAIWQAMEEAGVNKADLASRMGATKGYISQVLGGSRNMTLRTLADICFALDRKPVFRMEAQPTVTPRADVIRRPRG